MLEKNNKISVLTKMIGIGDEKTPQLIVPQNSLTNFHARMGLSEKSVNAAASGAQAPTISCPHCQNMAKNFLYLESLIRANGSPKNKCSLCSSTLRYVEYVNKSILDVFAKNTSIIEAAQKYNAAKPRFRMPKLMSRVSRLTAGGRKTGGGTDSANPTIPTAAAATTTTRSSGNKQQSPKRKSKANDSNSDVKVPSAKSTKTKSNESKKAGAKTKSSRSSKLDTKISLKGVKTISPAKITAGRTTKANSLEGESKSKIKTKKASGIAVASKKESLKTKRKAAADQSTTSTGTEREAFSI